MIQILNVTPELVRQYAGKNCWTNTRMLAAPYVCGQRGPSGGQCTLKYQHEGSIHIAHNHANNNSGLDHTQIFQAWTDGDPDLDMDEGL